MNDFENQLLSLISVREIREIHNQQTIDVTTKRTVKLQSRILFVV